MKLHGFVLTLLVAVALVAVALVAVACNGGGDDDDAATPAPNATGGDPAATATVNELVPAPAGVPPLVYDALVTKDVGALAGLTYYEEVACAAEASPEAPACRPDEDAGSEVAVFRRVACDAAWIRPEQVSDAYNVALGAADVTLVAAYAPAGDAFPLDREIITALVARSGDDASASFLVGVDDGGRIAVLEYACDNNAEALYAADRVANFIVEP
jgi:hypothetical protein